MPVPYFYSMWLLWQDCMTFPFNVLWWQSNPYMTGRIVTGATLQYVVHSEVSLEVFVLLEWHVALMEMKCVFSAGCGTSLEHCQWLKNVSSKSTVWHGLKRLLFKASFDDKTRHDCAIDVLYRRVCLGSQWLGCWTHSSTIASSIPSRHD